jgi:hypothetical protein
LFIWGASLGPLFPMQWSGFKSFATRTPGRAILIIIAILALVGSFVFLNVLIAIPAFLIFGLALPIYLGWKSAKGLAIAGLIILVVAAPIVAAASSSLLREPTPPVSSDNFLPAGNGCAVLQNASVTPYTGAVGNMYVWNVTVVPHCVPANDSPVQWLNLYVSTCPGATGNSSPTCGSGYPFWALNDTSVHNLTNSSVAKLTQDLSQANVWYWVMEVAVINASGKISYIGLDPGTGDSYVEGPVTGDYLSTYVLILPSIGIAFAFYLALVFYFALLIYVLFKNRERRKKAMAADRPRPPSTPGSPGPPMFDEASTGATPTARSEPTCPNCSAVVYPNEATCWKCGAPLTKADQAPLPSQPP